MYVVIGWPRSPFCYNRYEKKKEHNKERHDRYDTSSNYMSLANKKTIDMLGEFLYNYLDMKGDTDKYTKFMEDKIDGLLKQSSQRDGEVSRESLQEEEE